MTSTELSNLRAEPPSSAFSSTRTPANMNSSQSVSIPSLYGRQRFSVGQRVLFKNIDYDNILMLHAYTDLMCSEADMKKWKGMVGVVYRSNRESHAVDVTFYEADKDDPTNPERLSQIGLVLHSDLLRDVSASSRIHFAELDLALMNPFPHVIDAAPSMTHVTYMAGEMVRVNSAYGENVHVSILNPQSQSGVPQASSAHVPAGMLLPVYVQRGDSLRVLSLDTNINDQRVVAPRRLLIGLPRDVTAADWQKIYDACMNDDDKYVNHFMEHWPDKIDLEIVTNPQHLTPLMVAAANGKTRIVVLLTQPGLASLLTKRVTDGMTAVHFAAAGNHPGTLKVMLRMLQWHADRSPESVDMIRAALVTDHGMSLVQIALQYGANRCVAVLMNPTLQRIWLPSHRQQSTQRPQQQFMQQQQGTQSRTTVAHQFAVRPPPIAPVPSFPNRQPAPLLPFVPSSIPPPPVNTRLSHMMSVPPPPSSRAEPNNNNNVSSQMDRHGSRNASDGVRMSPSQIHIRQASSFRAVMPRSPSNLTMQQHQQPSTSNRNQNRGRAASTSDACGMGAASAAIVDSTNTSYMECAICMDQCIDTVYNCGHTACRTCAQRMSTCHICRAPIQQRMNLFL